MPCFEHVAYGPTAGSAPLDTVANVRFPNSGKHKLTVKDKYADDGVQVIYQENMLEIEATIYEQTTVVADIETEVARIRAILDIPGQQLLITPVGLGTTLTVNVGQPDVKGGPLPQQTIVEPLVSNNAILIRWTVIFHTARCPSPLTIPLIEYTVGQDLECDDDGNLTFVYKQTYRTKDPLTDISAVSTLSNILEQRTDRAFQGMRKSSSTTQSRDLRLTEVRLSYTDIPSDNAFFPNVKNIDVTDELESSLLGGGVLTGKGFYSWSRRIGGTIRLPPRVHKTWAWIVFLKILKERFKNIAPATKLATVLDVDPPPEVTEDPDVQTSHYYLPLKIKISNPLYKRQMSFEITYLQVTDLDSLIATSKIMDRVNTAYTDDMDPETTDPAETLSTQWLTWQQSQDRDLSGYYEYQLTGVPIVINQCTGAITRPVFGSNLESAPLEDDPALDIGAEETAANAAYPNFDDANLSPDEKYSWVAYENDFEIVEENDQVTVSFLKEPDSGHYESTGEQASNAERSATGMSLHGKLLSSSNTPPTNIARGGSTFFVRMKGYAIRVKHKIPIPSIVTIDSKVAKRVGTARATQKQIAQSDVPVYLAMWDILYSVEGDIFSSDILSTIVTSGAPGHFK